MCAYLRGGDVLVAVAVRAGARLPSRPGWQDVLGGAHDDLAVLERVGR